MLWYSRWHQLLELSWWLMKKGKVRMRTMTVWALTQSTALMFAVTKGRNTRCLVMGKDSKGRWTGLVLFSKRMTLLNLCLNSASWRWRRGNLSLKENMEYYSAKQSWERAEEQKEKAAEQMSLRNWSWKVYNHDENAQVLRWWRGYCLMQRPLTGLSVPYDGDTPKPWVETI